MAVCRYATAGNLGYSGVDGVEKGFCLVCLRHPVVGLVALAGLVKYDRGVGGCG